MIPSEKEHRDVRGPKSFLIAGENGFSEYWRRDKSPVEILELAKLLRGIRKMVSLVGRNSGSVVWEGMPITQPDSIELDPSPIMGRYPIPAVQADIAIGLAIRRAYLKTEWSGHVLKLAQTKLQLPPMYAYKFHLYLDIAEKVYADLVANRNILGRYAAKAREWETAKAAKQFISPPSFSELLHIWWRIAADAEHESYKQPYEDRSVVEMAGRTSASQPYAKPIALLNSIVEDLIIRCAALPSVTERCEYRLNRYASIFNQLLEMVKFWPADRKDPFLLSADLTEDMAREDQDLDAVKAALLSYADEIERTMETKRVDFTEQVRLLVANFGDVVRVEGNDIVMPAKKNIDNALLYKLKTMLQLAAQRNTSFSRGLDSGRIDRTRLYRAPTTGSIFNLKKAKFELHNDIVLLVDCTGSMAEPTKWSKAELIYQTLFTAIHDYNANARIFAYNERSETCRITEIYKQGQFFSVMPHGRTASGEAIIATAISLKPGARKPFIIHVTDGASNWGCGVRDAIAYCRKKKINLLTLGLECDPMSKTALSEEYGELIQFVQTIEQLPKLLKKLLAPR
ncbi:vWA domain-containing protein [Citrifermentans bremense]|uniref:vWA domain-containing protein n=1 Tax=Citrifermentans bremense TaxID=60035 RepID=UPI00041844C8|nr:vWA domain-containing protein [Citrifermentans bremense]